MPIFKNIQKAIQNKEFKFDITDGFDEDEMCHKRFFRLYTGNYRQNEFQLKYYLEPEQLFIFNTELFKTEKWFQNCKAAINKMDAILLAEEEEFSRFIHQENYDVEPIWARDIFCIRQNNMYKYQVIPTSDGRLSGSRVGSPLNLFDAGTQQHNLEVIKTYIDWKKYKGRLH